MLNNRTITTYLAIPLQYSTQAKTIENELTAAGIEVKNPCTLITEHIEKDEIPAYIAHQCYEMIEAADFLVLFADYYGRDCATEVGYAIKSQKAVFPFSLRGQKSDNLEIDWMIQPMVEPLSKSFDELISRIFDYFNNRHPNGTKRNNSLLQHGKRRILEILNSDK